MEAYVRYNCGVFRLARGILNLVTVVVNKSKIIVQKIWKAWEIIFAQS